MCVCVRAGGGGGGGKEGLLIPHGYLHMDKGSLTYRYFPRETSYVRLGGGGGRGGLAAVTAFLCKTSWKNSIDFFRKP